MYQKSIDNTEHFFKFSRLSFMVYITSAKASPVDIDILNPYYALSIIEYLFLKSTNPHLIIISKYLEICGKMILALNLTYHF